MKHLIKHKDGSMYVKNVLSDGNNFNIKFTEKKEKARRFVKYQAAENVIKKCLSNCYRVETVQEV